MYGSDYYYAYKNGGINCNIERDKCKTSWMYLSNNDSEAIIYEDITMVRTIGSSWYSMISIKQDGEWGTNSLHRHNVVRPVFYLNSDEQYINGDGTLDNPIMLKSSKQLSELCESGDNLGSCLTTNNEEIDSLNDNIEGGLYRYQGTIADNYICFGTTSKEECTGNTDAYMYRIIGIDNNGQLKLIKKEVVNETMQWYSDKTKNIT